MAIDAAVFKLAAREEYAELSDAEAANLANTKRVTQKDEKRKNYIAIALHFGNPSKVAALDNALDTAGLGWVQRSLGGEGLSFADPLTIASIDGLRQANLISQSDADALKAIGIWQVSDYVDAGGTGDCTEQQWSEARARLALDVVRAFVTNRHNDVIDGIEAGTITTVEAAKAALGA